MLQSQLLKTNQSQGSILLKRWRVTIIIFVIIIIIIIIIIVVVVIIIIIIIIIMYYWRHMRVSSAIIRQIMCLNLLMPFCFDMKLGKL